MAVKAMSKDGNRGMARKWTLGCSGKTNFLSLTLAEEK
jgi:hypothetical protein